MTGFGPNICIGISSNIHCVARDWTCLESPSSYFYAITNDGTRYKHLEDTPKGDTIKYNVLDANDNYAFEAGEKVEITLNLEDATLSLNGNKAFDNIQIDTNTTYRFAASIRGRGDSVTIDGFV